MLSLRRRSDEHRLRLMRRKREMRVGFPEAALIKRFDNEAYDNRKIMLTFAVARQAIYIEIVIIGLAQV